MVIEQNGLAGRASNCILANISTCLRVGLSCGALTLSLSCLKVPCQLSAGLVAYLKEPDETMDEEYVVVLKNGVKKLVQRHVGEN